MATRSKKRMDHDPCMEQVHSDFKEFVSIELVVVLQRPSHSCLWMLHGWYGCSAVTVSGSLEDNGAYLMHIKLAVPFSFM